MNSEAMSEDERRDALRTLRQRLAVAREKVIKASLLVASCQFDQRAEDPGWDAEMYEEVLDGAITIYVDAKAAVEGFNLKGDDNATEDKN